MKKCFFHRTCFWLGAPLFRSNFAPKRNKRCLSAPDIQKARLKPSLRRAQPARRGSLILKRPRLSPRTFDGSKSRIRPGGLMARHLKELAGDAVVDGTLGKRSGGNNLFLMEKINNFRNILPFALSKAKIHPFPYRVRGVRRSLSVYRIPCPRLGIPVA